MQSNRHPKAPDAARVVELRDERWVENVLHANRLRPTVEGRSPYSWEERGDDMELFKRPNCTHSHTTRFEYLDEILETFGIEKFDKLENECTL